jgi:enoyl-CoA hydratase
VIEITRRGNIAVLRMAHGKANALDLELCEALTQQLDECRRSSDGAIVLSGTGRMFSAGVDLPRVVDGGAAYVRMFLPALSRACEALFTLPKPVVAAINGHAIAGGCVLACAADYRMMAREPGRIGVPELLVGVPFPIVPLEIMRFVAPPQHLQSLVYRGLTLGADAALHYGLVDAVVDPERLLDDAIAVAEGLAALPPAAFALTKSQLREPALQRIRAGQAVDAVTEDAWASRETLTAIRDYVARTLPKK